MKLNDSIESHFRLGPEQKKALHRIGLTTIEDILYYFPTRYASIASIQTIDSIEKGQTVTLYGTIEKLETKKSWKTKIPMGTATIRDHTGKIKITWFHQPYLAKMITEGALVTVSGKVSESKNGFSLTNPEIMETAPLPIDSHSPLFSAEDGGFETHIPVYPETRGITSKWIYHAIQKCFKHGILDGLEDYIPTEILERYHLPTLKSAFIWIHTPRKEKDSSAARKRFAFEEIFLIQVKKQQSRHERNLVEGYDIQVDNDDINDFISRFPFAPTNAQKRAIDTILDNFTKPFPMARLLEGDVGSGKTAVAATSAYATIRNRPHTITKAGDKKKQSFGNLQVAYMAPTEILATQHFESFIEYFKHLNINIGLVTSSGCRKFPSKVASAQNGWTNISRTQLLKWVENGEVPILIGTHSLIQKKVKFKHLALVIIDEQHRFGTRQRAALADKDQFAPHLLSMTATPIPRTLALTIYGDLDLTLLDEMPAGRKEINTQIIRPDKRESVYEDIRKEMKNGRQLYIICPRIDEADPDKAKALTVKNVTTEAKRIKKDIFPEYEVGILHSKMTKEKKEEVMKEFSNNEVQILVATSVVEVGVNVPNATMIIIEGAERFGLAQLHQLRGRVVRSNHQAYCYLFAETKSDKTIERLKALVTAKNGFELSELDLMLRGAGELGGGKQWGISDLGMEAIKNIKLVEAARNEAQVIVETDAHLSNFPALSERLSTRNYEVHFE